MTPTVVILGPQLIRGPGSAPQQWISTAVEFIDDPVALLDEQPVDVAELLRTVLTAVAGEDADPLIIVVPTWWPPRRRVVVSEAAEAVSANSVVMQRSSILCDGSEATVVELSAEYAVVTSPGADPLIHARDDPAIVTHLEASTSVLLDIPAGVPALPGATTERLRRLGIPVTRSTDDQLRHIAAAAGSHSGHPVRGVGRIRPGRRASAVLAGTALAAAAAGGGWAAQAWMGGPPHLPAATPTTVLTEGGITVRVPASWSVERITSGSGSARIRVAAPGGSPALHLTQSVAPAGSTLTDAAESLRRAIESETDGIFADFDPVAQFGDRPAVSYVERRMGSVTRWAVVLDGAVRIAVGCQSAPDDVIAIEDICVEAVRSAQVVR